MSVFNYIYLYVDWNDWLNIITLTVDLRNLKVEHQYQCFNLLVHIS